MEKQHKVQCYAAPLEGITGYIYRNAHQHIFQGVDKYFTPFVTPKPKKGLNTREKNDIAPEHNKNIPVVPQILTNKAADFIKVAGMMEELGYKEVNLNLGCPSGTVVSKKKGSGFLDDIGRLDQFFETVFEEIAALPEERKCRVSVKTRIGMEFPEEFEDIMEVYNRYPFSEIIIHPRLQKDYYRNHPNLDVFGEALKQSAHPVCYNGDIFTKEDYDTFCGRFPTVERVMLGRGVVTNPGLVREIRTGQTITTTELKEYHDRLYAGYREAMGSEKDALFKMKEVWSYLGKMFPESERELKKVRKANRPEEYQEVVRRVFN